MFCLFDLILYVPSTIYQLNRDGSSYVEPVLNLDKCALLKDPKRSDAGEARTRRPRSQVKHSTTEPLRSQSNVYLSSSVVVLLLFCFCLFIVNLKKRRKNLT